ncbi:hypothetical protein CRU86_08595, partial [Aliarcobacter skirrowii]|uniref:hypothetical protein n=1 Tax=Aliarcobacter skirrowii TaxID=28200 RepID=UPI0010265D5F
MNLIYKILCLIFKRKETLIDKVCNELKITSNEFAKLINIPHAKLNSLTKRNSLIEFHLKQLLLEHKNEKKEVH